MKVYELLSEVDMQSEVRYAYYDERKECRIELTRNEANGEEVRYMYVDDGMLYIEVEQSPTTDSYRTIRGQSVRGEVDEDGKWRVYAYANGEWVRACTSFATDSKSDVCRYIENNLNNLHS